MNIPARFIPRDADTLDAYAARYPTLAEYFSNIADEEPTPVKTMAMYYGLLREAMILDN